ncbi:MAG: alpha/beta fold hydrolase [Terracidiphilus sp.]
MTTAAALSGSETSSEKPSLRTVDLRGPAGRLEALLNEGAADSQFVGLVCHPHPIGGGTMHNKVVYHAMKVLNAPEWGLRWPVLRFNFRGTGLSEGQHDGRAESADVSAALDWLQAEYKLPVVLLGFSFGAAMAIAASCGTDSETMRKASLRALVALGLPTQGFGHTYRYPALSECSLPKLFLSGDGDSFAPQQDLLQVVDTAADPKNLVLVPGADHFFTGQLDRMQRSLASWLKEQVQ